MTLLEFIADIVASLAWPVAIVVAMLLLRRYIPDTLRALRRVKISGFELELEKTRAEVQEALFEQGGRGAEPVQGVEDLTLKASKQDPVASILGSYAALESELRKRLALAGVPDIEGKTAVQLVTIGVRKGVFGEASADAVRGIAVMRNLAAHGRADRVTVQEAVEYASLVEATIYALGAKPKSE